MLEGDALLQEEVFGPATLVIEIADQAELVATLNGLRGQLTATVLGETDARGTSVGTLAIHGRSTLGISGATNRKTALRRFFIINTALSGLRHLRSCHRYMDHVQRGIGGDEQPVAARPTERQVGDFLRQQNLAQ